MCRTKDEWINAHKTLGGNATLLDRAGGANTFKNTQGGFNKRKLRGIIGIYP